VYETSRLQYDLEVICWEGAHVYWGGAFAIPMIVICFLIPFSGFGWMILN
jgi:hypothetical protein